MVWHGMAFYVRVMRDEGLLICICVYVYEDGEQDIPQIV